MLRLNFRSMTGDAPTLMLASCVRFNADGTLRGSDNCVVAKSIEGCWRVSGRLHRDLDCEGPVLLRLNLGAQVTPVYFGPFSNLRTVGALVYGDGQCLDVTIPGRSRAQQAGSRELTLIWHGATNAKN